ncbi:piggyBac transposable element-derived protein 3-like [Macrobrachium nipponense]|uniref:piggyBac transposable element-derived protein 3-like n=1 Tax=Macrobrachium nipponense TaxID=159736 RepID=UPI0030C80B12
MYQDTDSDEENDDDILDKDYMPEEVRGEVEVYIESESSDSEEEQCPDVPCRDRKWRKKENLSLGTHSIPSPTAGEHAAKDIYDIFKLFFTDEMVEHITEQTNLYAVRDKNCTNFHVAKDEIKKILGLMLMSGYHSVPSENDYWSTSEDLEIPIFPKTMSRDRFRSIKRYLPVADTSNLADSKIAKVLPLLEMLRERCQANGIFHEYLSIDESMIPYHGHHSTKQYLKNKPLRFGYKMWMLCSADGYPYNFELYCGKESKTLAS